MQTLRPTLLLGVDYKLEELDDNLGPRIILLNNKESLPSVEECLSNQPPVINLVAERANEKATKLEAIDKSTLAQLRIHVKELQEDLWKLKGV